jgi:protein gp37
MAETQIEWTDATWNPVAGCSVITAGCTNCYAMQMAKRLEAMQVEKYRGLTRRSGNRTVHDSVSDEFILAVWNVMRETPRHNYQILTKRPKRMAEIVTDQIGIILPNVWLGTSIENSDVIDRANDLRGIPAAIRFISFEPLIGPVGNVDISGIHWAIVGGESGSAARPIREEWIDEIYHQCEQQGTKFFFKQWGTWGKDNKRRSKKANGREYRGKFWNEMPEGVIPTH